MRERAKRGGWRHKVRRAKKHCLMIVTDEVWLSESQLCSSFTDHSQWQSAASAAAEHLPSCYHTAALRSTDTSLVTHKRTHTPTLTNTVINIAYTSTVKHPPWPILQTENLHFKVWLIVPLSSLFPLLSPSNMALRGHGPVSLPDSICADKDGWMFSCTNQHLGTCS